MHPAIMITVFLIGALFGVMAFWPTAALLGALIWFVRAALFISGWLMIGLVVVWFLFGFEDRREKP